MFDDKSHASTSLTPIGSRQSPCRSDEVCAKLSKKYNSDQPLSARQRPPDMWLNLVLRKKLMSVFDTVIFPMLVEEHKWKLEQGTRRCDKFFMPPGVIRGKEHGFKSRVHYFDSALQVMDFIFKDDQKYCTILDKAWEKAEKIEIPRSHGRRKIRAQRVDRRAKLKPRGQEIISKAIEIGPNFQVDPENIPEVEKNVKKWTKFGRAQIGERLCIIPYEKNVEKECKTALKKVGGQNGCRSNIVEAASLAEREVDTWSSEEKEKFFELMLKYKKDMYRVQAEMPVWRPCSELLQYYYSRMKSKATYDEYYQNQYQSVKRTCRKELHEYVLCRNDEECFKCEVSASGMPLLCCEGCPNVCHVSCAGLDNIPEGDWFCSNECTEKHKENNQTRKVTTTRA